MKVNITQSTDLVSLSMEPETSITIKTLMSILNLLGLILLIVGLYEWLLILLPVGILWCLFFGWLTLWNCFGREHVVISTTSLSYHFAYGIYQAKVETKQVNKALNISLIPARSTDDQATYQLVFESLNRNNRPEELYRTTCAISEGDLELLKQAIRKLYFKKIDPEYLKQPFVLN